MSRETDFYIYCLERYRSARSLSGAAASGLFEQYDVFSYVNQYFEVLHIMGDRLLVQDIEEYISYRQG